MQSNTQTSSLNAPDIIVLLDCSGSMKCMGNEPIEALNSFIESQKKVEGTAMFSLYEFSDNVSLKIDNVPLHSVQEYKDYKPSGMTALYECIHNSIQDKKRRYIKDSFTMTNMENIVLLIITDGQDNQGQRKGFKSETIKAELKEVREKHKWDVRFLVANEDAFTEATVNLGMSSSSSTPYRQTDRGGLMKAMSSVSGSIANHRQSSQYASQTDVRPFSSFSSPMNIDKK